MLNFPFLKNNYSFYIRTRNLPAMWETRGRSQVRKILWQREWLSSRVFLPGEFRGQKSLVNSSPWGRKKSDTTKQLTLSLSYQVKFRGPYCDFCHKSGIFWSSVLALCSLSSWNLTVPASSVTSYVWGQSSEVLSRQYISHVFEHLDGISNSPWLKLMSI